jgi:hypothetical protein
MSKLMVTIDNMIKELQQKIYNLKASKIFFSILSKKLQYLQYTKR